MKISISACLVLFLFVGFAYGVFFGNEYGNNSKKIKAKDQIIKKQDSIITDCIKLKEAFLQDLYDRYKR